MRDKNITLGQRSDILDGVRHSEEVAASFVDESTGWHARSLQEGFHATPPPLVHREGAGGRPFSSESDIREFGVALYHSARRQRC